MIGRVFLDTNILIYSIVQQRHQGRARAVMLQGHVISVQVLNEFTNAVRRKQLLSINELLDAEARFKELYDIVPLTVPLHDAGLLLATQYRFSLYDALIVAAALEADCDTLYTEDLQHNQKIEGRLRIVNPFR